MNILYIMKFLRKLVNSKTYFFLQDSLNEVESALDDSKSFWAKCEKIGEIDTKKTCMEIPGDKFYRVLRFLENREKSGGTKIYPRCQGEVRENA